MPKSTKKTQSGRLTAFGDDAPPLPHSGPLPRPESLEAAAIMLRTERIAVGDIDTVTFTATEFTSLCPRTGQPDFGTVEITITPRSHSLESKSLKFYLYAFREEGMFCERLAARIADDVYSAIEPEHLRVNVTQNPRGAIGMNVCATRRPSDYSNGD